MKKEREIKKQRVQEVGFKQGQIAATFGREGKTTVVGGRLEKEGEILGK